MSDQLWAALIGGGLVLLGTIIAQVFAARQAGRQFKNQSAQDERKHQWEMDDAHRARKIEVVEKRCEQVEQVVALVSEDFFNLTNESEYYAKQPDPAKVLERGKKRIRLSQDVKTFAQVAVIMSLGDALLNVNWNEMSRLYGEMRDYNQQLFILAGTPMAPPLNEATTHINDLASKFWQAASSVISRLDQLKGAPR